MRINDTEIEEYKELIKNANVYNLSGLYDLLDELLIDGEIHVKQTKENV